MMWVIYFVAVIIFFSHLVLYWSKGFCRICILTQHAYIGNGKELYFILQLFTGRKSVTRIAAVIAYLMMSVFVSLMLDCVTSFSCIKNLRNTCKRVCCRQTFGGISSMQWLKVRRIRRIQLLFHRFLHAKIELETQ